MTGSARVFLLLLCALAALSAPVSAQTLPAAPRPLATGALFSLSATAAQRGAELTITGTGAGAATSVRLGEWNAPILARDANAVVVLVPEAPAEAHSVTLALPTGSVTLRQSFNIVVIPDGASGGRLFPACPSGSEVAAGVTLTVIRPTYPKPGDALHIEGTGLSTVDAIHFSVRSANATRPEPAVFRAELVRSMAGASVRVPSNAISGTLGVVEKFGPGLYHACRTVPTLIRIDRRD